MRKLLQQVSNIAVCDYIGLCSSIHLHHYTASCACAHAFLLSCVSACLYACVFSLAFTSYVTLVVPFQFSYSNHTCDFLDTEGLILNKGQFNCMDLR